MNIKKSFVVAGAVATVGLTGIAGIGVASAATIDSKSTLIDKLVDKFDLNKGEVEAVFEEQRAEIETKMQERAEERLSQAVSEGKITEDQKAKILAKLAELKAEREADHEAVRNMTDEERRAHMEQKHEELKTWAEENGIPVEYLHLHGQKGIGMEVHAKAGGQISEKIYELKTE
jgi:polyhydroxyalkanoate synthesis regulator phasin